VLTCDLQGVYRGYSSVQLRCGCLLCPHVLFSPTPGLRRCGVHMCGTPSPGALCVWLYQRIVLPNVGGYLCVVHCHPPASLLVAGLVLWVCVSWCWLKLTHAVLRLCRLLLSEPVVCCAGMVQGPPVSHGRLVGVLAPKTSRCIEEVVQECAAIYAYMAVKTVCTAAGSLIGFGRRAKPAQKNRALWGRVWGWVRRCPCSESKERAEQLRLGVTLCVDRWQCNIRFQGVMQGVEADQPEREHSNSACQSNKALTARRYAGTGTTSPERIVLRV
jgi:hypothetical protein